MKVKFDGSRGSIEPTISITVTCALEDVEISDLKPKGDDLNSRLRGLLHGDISTAAAIQYLKRILQNADLESGVLDNRFSDLLVADILALPE